MRVRVEQLLAAIGDVVSEAEYEAEYEAEGGITLKQLRDHNKREVQSGRWQAMSARHHAHMALRALDEGDVPRAQAAYVTALEKWYASLTQLQQSSKAKRLAHLPKPPGRPPSGSPHRLYDLASPKVRAGIPLSQALREAVAGDPILKDHYRSASMQGLRDAYKRGST